MNSRTFSALQKTYDQSHLKSCTAVYYETQGNASDALQCWKETLTNITSHYASHRLPHNYRPRNDQEKVLLDSLHALECRARERISAIEDFLSGKPFATPPPPPPRKAPPLVPPRLNPSTIDLHIDRRRPNPPNPSESEAKLISPLVSPSEEHSKRSISYPIVAPRHAFNPPASKPLSQTSLKSTLRPNKLKKNYFFSSGSSEKVAPAAQAATMAWGSLTPSRQVSSSSVPVLQPMPSTPPDTTPPTNSPRMKSRMGELGDSSNSSSENLPKRQLNPSMGTEVPLPPAVAEAGKETATTILRFFKDNRHRRQRVQIEFVPPEFAATGSVLVDGTHIGLTKKGLVAAFTATRKDLRLNERLRGGGINLEEALRLMDATTIAILVDCENLSAINTRKRLVRTWPSVFRADEELLWVTGVVTSDLRKHVKSSLLWGYRRWLVKGEELGDFSMGWWKSEAEIIKRAAEVHPTNYYAWTYARWALQSVWEMLAFSSDSKQCYEHIKAVFEDMLDWCCRHVSDTSAWSFLLFIYGVGKQIVGKQYGMNMQKDILEQAKEIMHFGHDVAPGHEALWSFVRTVLSPGFLEAEWGLEKGLGDQRDGLVELIQKWHEKTPEKDRYSGPKRIGRLDHAEGSELRRPALSVLQTDPVSALGQPPPLPSEKPQSEWEQRVQEALKNLPKTIDPTAAQQILNEIITHGDEVHWSDVAGLEGAKTALKEVVVYPFLRPDLFSGLREPARGMLLFGPPGTGKTMLARAVATESRSTFFSISASSLASKWLGDSEKLVRALFAMAKELAPSIIFIDEIDSLLSSRSSTEHEASRRLKTEFLIHWSDLARAAAGKERTTGDPSRVLVLGATNLPWDIDDAARRRFVRRQYIPLPESTTRATQLRTLLAHQNHSLSETEFQQLVELTEGFSGSDITALAKDAAMGPLRSLGEDLLETKMEDIRAIGLQDFRESLRMIRPSVDKEGLGRFEEWARQFGERV